MASCSSRTDWLTCSTCDRCTGYSLFWRGSAAVRSSWGMESSRDEIMPRDRDRGGKWASRKNGFMSDRGESR